MSSRVGRRSVTTWLVVAALLLAVAACGGDDLSDIAPSRVPVALVPEHMAGGNLGVFENTDDSTKEALANTDPSTLVADTRVWEIRRGDRLVGTLQISTVLPKLDLSDMETREGLVGQVIVGQQSRIRVGDVEVFTTTANDKTVYLWFGSNLFQVLQTKDRGLDPETLLSELIEFQAGQEAWEPLPELLEFEE